MSASRLRWADVVAVGTVGLRAKRVRTGLTALGIAIGIAAMVAVVGISASSRADLLAELDELGTNLLAVQPGQDMFGSDSKLPVTAPGMVRRIGPVEAAAATRTVEGVTVRRTNRIPSDRTGGIAVVATEPALLDTLGATVNAGTFLNDATATQPAVVLGSEAAARLGIGDLEGDPLVWLGGQWFRVVGILDPVPLGPDIDRSALVGYPVAQELFGIDEAASTVRVRTDPDQVEAVRSVLAATANPSSPEEVDVTRPSDALAARARADETLTALLLGLGAVALVVGGVGIANVMVISVLERRAEIGVRRALGATRGHVRGQFLVESVLLAGLGGLLGVALGAATTAVYADMRGWRLAVPLAGLAGGVAASLVVGAVAGLYPAARAARLAPAEAVRAA
ncbi:MAG TPA: ABC transporter permease [Acidimicrobiales bacterium]|nr:ABC transporter permease [Acidimicrobiales bacterium]